MSSLSAAMQSLRNRVSPRLGQRHGWIGIDVGERELRIVQIARGPRGLRLERVETLNRQTLAQGAKAGSNLLPVEIKRLSKRFRGRTAAAVLPDAMVDFRTFNVPEMSDADSRAFLTQELQSDHPDAVFDCWEILSVKRDASRQLAVLITDEHVASQVGADLYSAGINCERIDGRPHALARAASVMVNGSADSVQAVIEIGETQTTTALVKNGQALFTRMTQQIGFGRIVEAVQSQLDLDEPTCRMLLLQYGVDIETAPGQAELRRALHDLTSGLLSQFCSDVKRTVDFTRTLPGRPIPQQFILTGPAAGIRGLDLKLQQVVQSPVRVWTMDAAPGVVVLPELAVAAALSVPGVAA